MAIDSSENKKEVETASLSKEQKKYILERLQARMFRIGINKDDKKYAISIAKIRFPFYADLYFNQFMLKFLIENFKYLCDQDKKHLVYKDKFSIMISENIYWLIVEFKELKFISKKFLDHEALSFDNVTKLEIRKYIFSIVNIFVQKNSHAFGIQLTKEEWDYEALIKKLELQYKDNNNKALTTSDFNPEEIYVKEGDIISFSDNNMENLVYLLAMDFTYKEIISNQLKIDQISTSIKNIFIVFKDDPRIIEYIRYWLEKDHIYLGNLFDEKVFNILYNSKKLYEKNSSFVQCFLKKDHPDIQKNIFKNIHKLFQLFDDNIIQTIDDLQKNLDFWTFIVQSNNAKAIGMLRFMGLNLKYSMENYKDQSYSKIFKHYNYLALLNSSFQRPPVTAIEIINGEYKKYIDLFDKFDFTEHYEKFANILSIKNGLEWMINNKDIITDISKPEGRIFNFISAIVPRDLGIDIYDEKHYKLLEILGNFKIKDDKSFYNFILRIDMQKIMSLNDPKHLEEYIKYPQSNNAFLAINSKPVNCAFFEPLYK